MKSLTYFHFGPTVPRDGCPIARLEVPEVRAVDAVSLVDFSHLLPHNAAFEKDAVVVLKDDLTHFLDRGGVAVTDRVSADGTPLFGRHDLAFPTYDPASAGAAIVVAAADGTQVDRDSWVYDAARNAVFHDLPADGVYFVVYPRAEGTSLVDRHHKELLSAAPAFHPAAEGDFLDGYLDPDSDAYLMEERDGQPWLWRITLPRTGTYHLRYTDRGLLRLGIEPLPQAEPWYVDVRNAVVLAHEPSSGSFLRYVVTEFDRQAFYPFPPLRLVAERQATNLGGGILDLGVGDLVVTTKTPLDVKIANHEGRVVRALTTDLNKAGKTVQGIVWEAGSLLAVDAAAGRVALHGPLGAGMSAKASFYRRDGAYRYVGINLNPAYNPGILGKRVAFLCKPYLDGRQTSISHLLIEADGTVSAASDPDIAAWLGAGKPFDAVKSNWIFVPGTSSNNSNNYLLLGIASVGLPLSAGQVTIVDARRRGGGIQDDNLEQALRAMPGAVQNWDLRCWDGPPEPFGGAVLVYLPAWLLRAHGEEEIRARAAAYMPAGAHLVIRYYGN